MLNFMLFNVLKNVFILARTVVFFVSFCALFVKIYLFTKQNDRVRVFHLLGHS